MGLHSEEISITTDAAAAATVYSSGVSGRIHRIKYNWVDITASAILTITAETHGDVIFSMSMPAADRDMYPRAELVKWSGAAITPPAYDHFIIQSDDRVKIVIASGGAAKTCSVTIYYLA